MIRLFIALVVLLCTIAPLQAQTKLAVDLAGGTCMGYELPCIETTARVEHFIRQFEVQGYGTYTPTDKLGGNSSNTYIAGATGIAWTKYLGLTVNGRHTWLKSDQFNKRDARFSVGAVKAFRWLDSSQRLYAAFVIPTGGYNSKTGIESNRLMGPEFRWEANLWRNIDLHLKFKVLRVLHQGNPSCDGSLGGAVTCQRKSTWEGSSTTGITFTWGVR